MLLAVPAKCGYMSGILFYSKSSSFPLYVGLVHPGPALPPTGFPVLEVRRFCPMKVPAHSASAYLPSLLANSPLRVIVYSGELRADQLFPFTPVSKWIERRMVFFLPLCRLVSVVFRFFGMQPLSLLMSYQNTPNGSSSHLVP